MMSDWKLIPPKSQPKGDQPEQYRLGYMDGWAECYAQHQSLRARVAELDNRLCGLVQKWRDAYSGDPDRASANVMHCADELEAALDKPVKLESNEPCMYELIEAIKALPVEEWVEQDKNGDPVLIGYVMQASGEWDRVLSAMDKINNE